MGKSTFFLFGSNVKIQHFDNFLRFFSGFFFFPQMKDTVFNDLAFPSKLSNNRSQPKPSKMQFNGKFPTLSLDKVCFCYPVLLFSLPLELAV